MNPFLHARAARRREHHQRRLLHDRQPCRGQHTLADRKAHGTAHERKIEGRHDGLNTAQLAVRDENRVLRLGFCLRFLEPVRVTLEIAKLERIGYRRLKFDFLVLAVVEQHV